MGIFIVAISLKCYDDVAAFLGYFQLRCLALGLVGSVTVLVLVAMMVMQGRLW